METKLEASATECPKNPQEKKIKTVSPIDQHPSWGGSRINKNEMEASMEAYIAKNKRLLANLKGQLRRKNPKVDDILELPNGKWTIWCGASYVGTYDTAMDALDFIERAGDKSAVEQLCERLPALTVFTPSDALAEIEREKE